VWLVCAKKHSGIPSVSYEDAVEEALCFAWIDSVRRSIDADFHEQWFSPRKPRSVWSKPNKLRVARLVKEGLMTPAGLALVDLAKRTGTWNALAHVDSPTEPEPLRAALDAEPRARRNWDALAPSVRKQFLYWLANARREETRGARIKEIVRRVSRNLTLAQPRTAPLK
jgi:uncharacterized protein YdeI (YjbR/CyaY-like superfamily)